MDRGRNGRRLFLALCLAAPVSDGFADAYANFDYAYRSGDFGSTSTTKLTSYTLTLGVIDAGTAYSVAIPYQSLKDDATGDVSGLGDIILSGSHDFPLQSSNDSKLTAGAVVKVPTADDTDGLGSGEMDFGFTLGWSAAYGEWRPMINVGYTFVGDPAGVDYNDVVSYSLGVFRRLDRSGVFVSLDGRSELIDGADPAREISAGGFYVLNSQYALNGGAFIGLTDGSADSGFNLGFLRRF